MEKSESKPSLYPVNYYLITAGVCIIILGFIIMATGFPSASEQGTSAFSFSKITLAPVIILAGYLVIMFSLFYKRKITIEEARN